MKYTVLLLYPDHCAEREVYIGHVETESPEAAVAAERAFVACGEEIDDPTDLFPIAVFEGFLDDLPLEEP